jgi:hypothetical protein
MKKNIYRKASLDKIASPEQLDQMLTLTSPCTWIAIVGGIVCTAAVLIWTFFAWIPSKVSASGIYGVGETGSTVRCYVSLKDSSELEAGMTVYVYLSSADSQIYGHMEASLISVDDDVSDSDELRKELGSSSLADYLAQSGPLIGIVCELKEDPKSENGYKWTREKGMQLTLRKGSLLNVEIETGKEHPITMMIPSLQD